MSSNQPKENKMTEQELTKLENDLTRFLHEMVDIGAVYNLEVVGKTIQAIQLYSTLNTAKGAMESLAKAQRGPTIGELNNTQTAEKSNDQ
jgi:hypothetical protein